MSEEVQEALAVANDPNYDIMPSVRGHIRRLAGLVNDRQKLGMELAGWEVRALAAERENELLIDAVHALFSNHKGLATCCDWSRTLASLVRIVASQPRRTVTYDSAMTCQDCGEHHYLDCTLPSSIWNEIADPSSVLCARCIDKRLVARGLTAECKFYFVGENLVSALYEGELADSEVTLTAEEVVVVREALGRLNRDLSSGIYDQLTAVMAKLEGRL